MAKKPTLPVKARATKAKVVATAPVADPEQQQRIDAANAKELKRWTSRVIASNRVYDRWAEEFECKHLEDYYKGRQWRGLPEDVAKKAYTINLIFPTIEMQLPSLMFYRPKVKVEPRPGHADDAKSIAAARADLLEYTVQTFIDDPKVHFKQQTLLALRDAPFRFAVIEVGYTGDWIDNPNAGKPILKENSEEPMLDGEGATINEPNKVPRPGSEGIFAKRIPPSQWRVSISGKNITEENDWCGYFEYHYVEDLKKNPRYDTKGLRSSGTWRDMPQGSEDAADREKHAGMVKVWKLWDLRANVKIVFAEGHDRFLLKDDPFAYLPFSILKFYELADEWYPLPPVFNWLSPQDEINESREQQRNHRRRFTRRYTTKVGSILPTEREKLENGPDGVIAESLQDNPIVPVPDADLSGQNWAQLAASKEDFQQITGLSGEQRGVAEADTATQANIINVRAQMRESQARVQVSDWLANIARIMVLCIREKMQLPFWVQRTVDPFAADAQAAKTTAELWQQITSKDLGDIDVDVKVDIASLSPISEEALRNAWNAVLMMLANPTMLMILMTPNPAAADPNEPSPLLRKTLGFYGIKSDSEVREISRVGRVVMAMQMAAAAAAGDQKGIASPPAGDAANPGTPTGSPMLM
jgi:hypothetical protein